MMQNVNIQQNRDFQFPDNAALNINVPPAGFDLNVVPGEAFIELNDLVNPAPQNQDELQQMDIDHAAPGDSSLTLTISSDPSASQGSGGSVNGGFVGPPNNLQIGLAMVPEIQGDPGFLSREGASAWRKFFKPSSVSACHSTISVPIDWVEFLMCKLMTPEDYKWTSSLMQSKVWDIITRNSDHDTMNFLLPSSCPARSPPVCAIQEACKEVMTGFSTPRVPRKSSKLCAPPSTSKIHCNKKKEVLWLSLKLEGVEEFRLSLKDTGRKPALIKIVWLVLLLFLSSKAKL
jgi:hypothetical protein